MDVGLFGSLENRASAKEKQGCVSKSGGFPVVFERIVFFGRPLRRASGHYPKIVEKQMENQRFCSWLQHVLPSWNRLFST